LSLFRNPGERKDGGELGRLQLIYQRRNDRNEMLIAGEDFSSSDSVNDMILLVAVVALRFFRTTRIKTIKRIKQLVQAPTFPGSWTVRLFPAGGRAPG
jgi:hypothetical protein